MSKTLEKKLVLVTGAGRGIGKSIALSLAKEGAMPVLLARTISEIEAVSTLISEQGGTAYPYVCDLSQADAIFETITKISQEIGTIDILVANAGIAPSVPFEKTTLSLWQKTISINLTGVFLCMQAVLPGMLSQGWGRIVCIASTAAKKGYLYTSAYCASKHGVLGLVRSLALELAEKGITVNALCPGFVDTPMTSQAVQTIAEKTQRSQSESRKFLEKLSPQKRLMTPEEVAYATVFLCQEEARGITGQGIVISGGEFMS